MAIAFFQLASVFGHKLFAICIQNDNDGQPKTCGLPVFRNHVTIVASVHIDQNHHIIGLEFFGNALVALEEVMQPVAPNCRSTRLPSFLATTNASAI